MLLELILYHEKKYIINECIKSIEEKYLTIIDKITPNSYKVILTVSLEEHYNLIDFLWSCGVRVNGE